MRAATRRTLLWGVIGGLSFLVLAQGYQLVTTRRIDPAVLLGVALVVAAVTTVLAGLFRTRRIQSERD